MEPDIKAWGEELVAAVKREDWETAIKLEKQIRAARHKEPVTEEDVQLYDRAKRLLAFMKTADPPLKLDGVTMRVEVLEDLLAFMGFDGAKSICELFETMTGRTEP